MKAMISGLINIETTLKINSFPIDYYPIDYPFFGINSGVSGVAYNLTKAFMKLGDDVELFSYIGKDEEGERILKRLSNDNISTKNIICDLKETPASVVLYDNSGKRQIYCDLKDIQDQSIEAENKDVIRQIQECDLVVACNINFNRTLIKKAKELGKTIATDVHVINDIDDSFNSEFIKYTDILFLSDEQLPCEPKEFIKRLIATYSNSIIVIGLGSKGAMLYVRQEDKIYLLDAIKCDNIVNTVGAGDALFTGFLHYYLNGHSPLESLIRAEIFASVKIGFNGAAKGFCDENTVEKLLISKRPEVHIDDNIF